MFGIDVSEHNSQIDWNKLKGKIDFAILRLGWIGNENNHTLDTYFERNYNECKRLGIPIGVYVYNYCNSEDTIRSGANWTLERLNGKSLELPIYLDMEDSSIISLGKTKLTNMCIEFNTVIEGTGLRGGVYANRDWFDNYLENTTIKNKFATWIAHYGLSGTNQYQGVYDMWQNSESGKLDGISGNVDTNYMYRNLIAEIGKPVSNNVNIQEEGEEEMKTYQNGNTPENVYSDTDLTNKIGGLDPGESCDCLGIFNNRAIVRYKVDGTNNYKIGFVEWLGGIK